jgi:hypothetical protein
MADGEQDLTPSYRLEAVDHDPFPGGYRPMSSGVQFQHRLMRVLSAANATRDAMLLAHRGAPTTPESTKQFQDAFRLYGAKSFEEKLARLKGGGGGYQRG